MIKSRLSGILTVCLTVCLTACVSISPAPAGAYKVGKSEVTLGRTWSNVSSLSPGMVKQAKLLSIDGPFLNRLYVVDGLPEGASLLRAPSKDKPMPKVRSNMSAIERIEFVADTVTSLGYLRVETARPRPAKLGQADGVRFDVAARTPEGLDISGTGVVSEVGGKLYMILYLAPAEYYYGTLLPEVERIMSTAKLG